MEELACVGLCPNASKTVVLTNEARPPTCLILTNQEAIVVKANNVGHKWLGCILSAGADGRSTLDITFHLQAASRAFFANKQILCDKKVRLAVRLHFFDRVVTPVALFASGHRTIRMSDLYKLDVAFRKMLRMIVEWEGSSTSAATWIEILVRTMPQTALEVPDACCQFASEQVGQTSGTLESEWCTKTWVPTA